MRRYCSRCLQTLGSLDPERCPGGACRVARPARGWPSFLEMGTTLDERFVAEEILGAGGAGITYRCVDLVDGNDVAVKVLHDDRRNGVLANRLAIEGELLELLHHPHIVPFHALRLIGEGPLYLATRHMRGGSLEGSLRRGGPLTAQAVAAIGAQLCLALEFIHSQGIVHRDLKPGNVLLESAGEAPVVRLADFGIARVFRDHRPVAGLGGLTRTGVFIGTPEYAAPEQIRGEKGIGPAADAFALGALLHYCATGQALLKRSEIADWSTFRERRRDPTDRVRLAEAVPAGLAVGRGALLVELDAIIDALMHPDAEARVSLGDVALALGASPSDLPSRDLAPLAPRTLVSALDGDWDDDDDEMDALVPVDEDDVPTGLQGLPNLLDLVSVSSNPQSREPITELGARRREPAWPSAIVPRPALVLPPPLDPNSAPEWREGEIDWPSPAKRRRNRLHAAALFLLAAAAGLALAWPGGVPALLGEQRLTTLGEPVQRWATDLTAAAPVYTASAPWAGKRVISARVSDPTPSPAAPPRVVAVLAAPLAAPAPAAVKAPSAAPAPSPPRIVEREPAPSPSPAEPAVMRWASNPADRREVADVVQTEVGRAQAAWITSLADQYDARAERHKVDADVDDVRRAALFRAWDRQVRTAQELVEELAAEPAPFAADGCTEEEDAVSSVRR